MEESKPSDWDLASEAFLRISKIDEPFEEPVNDRLIELADIDAGYTVVDVATGIGDPALSVARRVGPAGRVIATDQSAAMLAIAERRARERGLTNIEFRQLDANAYDFPDATIDAVVCRWGLMFVSDLDGRAWPHAAFPQTESPSCGRDVGRGRQGADHFDQAQRHQRLRSTQEPERSVSSVVCSQARGLGGGGRFRRRRGHTSGCSVRICVGRRIRGGTRMAHESRLTALLARPAAQQAEFWRALAAAAVPYAGRDGVVRVPSEILLMAARTRA